jgi:hypothetical protein
MRFRPCGRRRRAGALAEGVITLPLHLMLMLRAVETGIVVFSLHEISETTHQRDSKGICQGSPALSELNRGLSGPTALWCIRSSTSSLVTTNQSFLSTLNRCSVTIQVTWPEGGNDAEQRVTNLVGTSWTSMTNRTFDSPTHLLPASATIPIAHCPGKEVSHAWFSA